MKKEYTTSGGWVIDLRRLRAEDRLAVTEWEGSPEGLTEFIDGCFNDGDYFGRDIRKATHPRIVRS
jgi:hypothetical protein